VFFFADAQMQCVRHMGLSKLVSMCRPRKASLHYMLLKGLWDGLGVQQGACCCQVEDREKDLECEVRPSVQKNVG
jgi:hypothetical protein